MRAVAKVKSLFLNYITRGKEWTLQKSTCTGLWKTERGSFGQIRPKSTDLAQMGGSGPERRERGLVKDWFNPLLILEGDP
jgi:hypothetical protein